MTETAHDAARFLVGQAILAPSSHNTQPWVFRVGPAHVDLHRDPGRALPVNDPRDRELTISCGCALLNLRAAAAARGLGAVVRRPEPAAPDGLARLALDAGGERDPALAALARFIPERRTVRGPFSSDDAPPEAADELAAAAAAEGVRLHWVTDAASRETLAGLVAAGDRLQWSQPAWRRELATWMRPRRRGDGIGLPAAVAPLARLAVTRLDLGRRIARRDADLARAAPLLAVLVTGADTPADWLAAGQGLQRVLLTACRAGLQAGYLNQPAQVASLRPRLGALVGEAAPQLVIRLGRPVRAPRGAPRRALEEGVGRPRRAGV